MKLKAVQIVENGNPYHISVEKVRTSDWKQLKVQDYDGGTVKLFMPIRNDRNKISAVWQPLDSDVEDFVIQFCKLAEIPDTDTYSTSILKSFVNQLLIQTN